MAADDDDDFWADEDFIATIENVVKKAEEASAARHGGTQSGAPTPRSSEHIPPQFVNSLVGEAGPSIHDSPHVLGSLSSRPSNGTTAFQGVSLLGQSPGGAGGVGEESGPYGQLMAEKDGMISVLRSRVQQAEQQLDEFRRRTNPHNVYQPSLHQQQLELERCSSLLLFKDHEIAEAQRARTEKEERLKDALAETVALKEELEKLKKSRQTGSELKRPRSEGDIDVAVQGVDCCGVAPVLPLVNVRNTTGVSKQSCDPWSPPWMPEGISEAEENPNTELGSKTPKDASDMCNFLRLQNEGHMIETLKMRTRGNGCVTSSDGKEFMKSDKLQANEGHNRDMSRLAGTSITPRADGLNYFSRTSELCYSLQQLWGLKGVRNDGMSLLSKLFAGCRNDLYVLLSSGESLDTTSLGSSDKRKEGQIESGKLSEKLHTALAKVTNGLAYPEIIVTPLLEFCKLENVTLVGSALHLLRCILHHDSTCRQKLLSSGIERVAHGQVQHVNPLEKQENRAEGKGWYIHVAPKESSIQTMSHSAVFSSPRIRCRPRVGETPVQQILGKKGVSEVGVEEGGCEPPKEPNQLQQLPRDLKGTRSGDSYVPVDDLNLVVKWMLQLALTSPSSNVKFEAVAIIGVLIVNSEPLVERERFGFLLFQGGIDLLLKEAAGAEIQLQAVRIVHLLFHCPTVFQRFCVGVEGDRQTTLQSKDVNKTDAQSFMHLERQNGKLPVVDGYISIGQNPDKSTADNLVQKSDTVTSKVKLLEGMTDCLKCTGKSLQGHALHRSVIRLLAFMATSGDTGAAAVLQAGVSREEPELGLTCRDDAKIEGVVGGDGASGQHIVGNGYGSTHLKGLDLGDKGSGIPVGALNESVDDTEKAQNIPQRLVALIDSELDIDEREGWNEPSIAEERDRLIREAVTLLCRLSSDTVQSPVVIGHLISNKDMARLTLSVTNRLVTRKQSRAGQKPAVNRNFDIVELARGLRRRVLNSLAES